jgi:hypothetical protein
MYGYNPATIPNFSEADLSRRQLLKLITGGAVLGLSGVLVGNGRLVMAQGTPATMADYPSVSITAENDGDGYKFGVPDTFPTGYVAVTLVNKSDADHHAMFMKMNPDVTTDQFIQTATTSPDPGALAPLAVSIGGPGSISAGQQSTVIMNLEEGPYVLICEVPGPDGTPHYKMGMITAVDAAPAGTPVTTAPTAETTVDLVDFAFDGLPTTLTTGQHIWEVTDTGKQPHEMAIMLLSPGVTADAALGILSSSEAPATPADATAATPAAPATTGPPFTSVAGAAPMSPGQTVWPILNLAAGDYLTVCFIPDPTTGKPHFMLGMSAAFTVA